MMDLLEETGLKDNNKKIKHNFLLNYPRNMSVIKHLSSTLCLLNFIWFVAFWTRLFGNFCQVGVIKAVKGTLATSEEITALWVTHRLEELRYADGAIYMEEGQVVMHGDASTVKDFIEARLMAYTKQIYS